MSRAESAVSQEPAWLFVPQWLLGDIWHFPYSYDTFRRHIPAGSSVLEVGFGSGRTISRLAAELGCECCGVEVSTDAFSSLDFFSQREGVQVAAVRGDGFALPFRAGSFDVVYSEGVIEHFPLERSAHMVREHARVCRPGGLVIVSTPNKFAFVHSLTKAILGSSFLFYPEASLSTFQLSRLLAQAGLATIARDGFAFGCQFYMLHAFVVERFFPAAVGRIGRKILNLFRRTGLYHFRNPRLNSLIGFQTLVVGRRQLID